MSAILRVSCESEEEKSVDEPMEDQTGSQAREPDVDDDAGLPCHSFPFRKVIRQTGPNKGKEKYCIFHFQLLNLLQSSENEATSNSNGQARNCRSRHIDSLNITDGSRSRRRRQ